MATEVTAWEANDGSLHKTPCEAATRNVELLVQRSPLSENSPYAKKLVEWLTQNPRAIREVLQEHERACPREARDEASENGQKGPATKDPAPSWREDVIDEHHGRTGDANDAE